MSDAAAALGCLSSKITAEVLRTLKARLAATGSPLVADRVVSEQLAAQVSGILDRAIASMSAPGGSRTDLDYRRQVVAVRDSHIGRVRANQNIHPSDSLAAASLLFDVSLDAFLKLAPGKWDPAITAVALHHAILENVGPASTTYVNVLLGRLSAAHTEERLAISRDLHDRVASGIAVAQQQVYMSGFADGDGDQARNIRAAMEALRGALADTQSIAMELRYLVGSKQLHEAVLDFAENADPSQTPVLVSVTGVPQRLMSGVQEEAFIVIRELVGNARRHANANTIHVDFSWAAMQVSVAVSDDGHGFNRADIRSGALGLISARERAEVIGGEMEIVANAGVGTVVTLRIPITEVET